MSNAPNIMQTWGFFRPPQEIRDMILKLAVEDNRSGKVNIATKALVPIGKALKPQTALPKLPSLNLAHVCSTLHKDVMRILLASMEIRVPIQTGHVTDIARGLKLVLHDLEQLNGVANSTRNIRIVYHHEKSRHGFSKQGLQMLFTRTSTFRMTKHFNNAHSLCKQALKDISKLTTANIVLEFPVRERNSPSFTLRYRKRGSLFINLTKRRISDDLDCVNTTALYRAAKECFGTVWE